jgi:hypothetical protein
MDTVTFLCDLKRFTEEKTKTMILPTKAQKGETEAENRPPNVYLMSLPNGRTATKYAPYVLIKKVTGSDVIGHGRPNRSVVTVRMIFCVYNLDPEEGNLMLLNLMERMRICLLKYPLLYNRYRLYTGDEDSEISSVIYQEDIEPYYAGELITVWEIPSVQEEPTEMDDRKDIIINVGKETYI